MLHDPLKILPANDTTTRRWPLIGTPDEIIDWLAKCRAAGVSGFVLDTCYSVPELAGETRDSRRVALARFTSEIASRMG